MTLQTDSVVLLGNNHLINLSLKFKAYDGVKNKPVIRNIEFTYLVTDKNIVEDVEVTGVSPRVDSTIQELVPQYNELKQSLLQKTNEIEAEAIKVSNSISVTGSMFKKLTAEKRDNVKDNKDNKDNVVTLAPETVLSINEMFSKMAETGNDLKKAISETNTGLKSIASGVAQIGSTSVTNSLIISDSQDQSVDLDTLTQKVNTGFIDNTLKFLPTRTRLEETTLTILKLANAKKLVSSMATKKQVGITCEGATTTASHVLMLSGVKGNSRYTNFFLQGGSLDISLVVENPKNAKQTQKSFFLPNPAVPNGATKENINTITSYTRTDVEYLKKTIEIQYNPTGKLILTPVLPVSENTYCFIQDLNINKFIVREKSTSVVSTETQQPVRPAEMAQGVEIRSYQGPGNQGPEGGEGPNA